MAVKNRLKVILAEKRIQQNELAEAIGVTKATISNIINEKQGVTLENAMDISEFLKMKIEDVFYKEVPFSDTFNEAMENFEKLIQQMNLLYSMYEENKFSRNDLVSIYHTLVMEFLKKYRAQVMDYCWLQFEENDNGIEINPIAYNVIRYKE